VLPVALVAGNLDLVSQVQVKVQVGCYAGLRLDERCYVLPEKISDLLRRETSSYCIMLSCQGGRRGFKSRLPLNDFEDLGPFGDN
jgi:hypothetical protein